MCFVSVTPLRIITGTSNKTIMFGAPPCPKCGADQRISDEFHGHWYTLCVGCGEEL